MTSRVEIKPWTDVYGQKGYDLEVADPQATVGDYLAALNQYILRENCSRQRAPKTKACAGCDRCCAERIPLTAVDLLNLSRATEEESWARLLGRHTFISVEGPVVDITLRREADGRCSFLDPLTGRCRIYCHRPLVCQTFICCPVTLRAQEVREQVVNLGEDEAVRRWGELAGPEGTPPVHEALDFAFDPQDYPPNAFTGRLDFNEIKVRDLVTPDLWQRLKPNQSSCRRSGPA